MKGSRTTAFTLLEKEGMRPLRSRMPFHLKCTVSCKKAHTSPKEVLTSFFRPIIIKMSSLIETFYWTEDILSEQIFAIIEKIHQLTDW